MRKILKKLEETLRIKIGVRCLGEKKKRFIEREIKQNKGWIAWGGLNRSLVNLDKWRCWEVSRQLSRKVSRKWSSTDIGIEVSRNNPSDARTEARSIHKLSRSYRWGRRFLDLSTRYWEAVKIAIWKSLRSSTDSMVSRRCQGGVELAFKNGFLTREKYRHECNQARNSTKDPISNLNSQNHLST